MRKLTNYELRKLKCFREVLDEYCTYLKKGFFGKLKYFFNDFDYLNDFVCTGIDDFLTHNIDDMNESLKKRIKK